MAGVFSVGVRARIKILVGEMVQVLRIYGEWNRLMAHLQIGSTPRVS